MARMVYFLRLGTLVYRDGPVWRPQGPFSKSQGKSIASGEYTGTWGHVVSHSLFSLVLGWVNIWTSLRRHQGQGLGAFLATT